MNIKQLIAIPAIALVAGIGLAACGSSGSPYAQGKAWYLHHGDDSAVVAPNPEALLQSWCAEWNPGEGSAWNSGCEAGYFQNHPSDYTSWGPGASTVQSAPSSSPAQAPASAPAQVAPPDQTEPASVTVPNVVNGLYTNALETLQGAGFNVIVKRVAPDTSIPAAADQNVQSQTPAGGTSAAFGSEVTIYIPNA